LLFPGLQTGLSGAIEDGSDRRYQVVFARVPERCIAQVAVIDIKTKAFGPQDDPQGFDEHLMQLAAYRSGLILPEANCANVFVSTTHAGLVSLFEWTKADVERGWLMFESLLKYWQAKNNYQ